MIEQRSQIRYDINCFEKEISQDNKVIEIVNNSFTVIYF